MPSKKYKIKNLSIDIGGSTLSTDIVDIFGKFGLRFFLSNSPLPEEYDRLKLIYPSSLIDYNNVLQTSPNFTQDPITNDIIDSSNSDFLNSIYYNNFYIYDVPYSGSPARYSLNKATTQTISEYNFFSINYFKFVHGSTISGLIATNNDISDFSFLSNSYKFLNFSIYPGFQGTGSSGSFMFNFTVNFDLEEF